MSILSYIKRKFLGPSGAPLADDDMSWFYPPNDMHDGSVWDRYWLDQLAHGLSPQLFDLFSNDRRLIEWVKAKGMRTILCVGNGLSQEPHALARAGFIVTVLDLSPKAIELSRVDFLDDKYLQIFLDPQQMSDGGSVEFVVGDLLDESICPGPFDMIMERRTVQLYPENERERALLALTGRLVEPGGVLFSHCHSGSWRPPEPRTHPFESWFREQGWTIKTDQLEQGASPQTAWLFFTTG